MTGFGVEVLEVRVATLDVVEVVDVVADGAQRCFARSVALVVDELGPQGCEEALGDSVVPAIAFAAHALPSAGGSERGAVVLAPPVRREHAHPLA